MGWSEALQCLPSFLCNLSSATCKPREKSPKALPQVWGCWAQLLLTAFRPEAISWYVLSGLVFYKLRSNVLLPSWFFKQMRETWRKMRIRRWRAGWGERKKGPCHLVDLSLETLVSTQPDLGGHQGSLEVTQEPGGNVPTPNAGLHRAQNHGEKEGWHHEFPRP